MRWANGRFTGATPWPHYAALALLVALTCGLYLPFLDNPLVFDDRTFFSGKHFAYYAMHPLGVLPRTPAYFSLAVTHVLSERIEAHRLVSLAFHLAVALLLCRFIYDLLRTVRSGGAPAQEQLQASRAALCALAGAGAFALHPVAVYGAAYLVQRSTVSATLFGLLSLWLFLHALRRDRYALSLGAAACYALAVFSKEHAILLAAVALPLAWLVGANLRRSIRHLAAYFAVCAPAAVFVVLMSRQLIGQAYEPHIADIQAQLESGVGHESGALSWPLSAATQMGLFLRYLAVWFWPDTSAQSIDWRVDFFASASPGWIVLKLAAFAACGALAALLVRRRGRAGMAGLGLLYAWTLFLVELSVIRFQEPFALYRSYLWAPGFAIMLAAALDCLGRRTALAAFALAAPFLMFQAHDRLSTFASPLRLWEDAVAKLPPDPVPWGSRVLYNLGREYLYARQPGQAIATVERCMTEYPGTFQCVYARGAIHHQMGQFELARTYFERAAAIEPGNGIVQHRIGMTLEKLGRTEEAKQRYRRASALGFRGGNLELSRLGEAGTAPIGRGAKASP